MIIKEGCVIEALKDKEVHTIINPHNIGGDLDSRLKETFPQTLKSYQQCIVDNNTFLGNFDINDGFDTIGSDIITVFVGEGTSTNYAALASGMYDALYELLTCGGEAKIKVGLQYKDFGLRFSDWNIVLLLLSGIEKMFNEPFKVTFVVYKLK